MSAQPSRLLVAERNPANVRLIGEMLQDVPGGPLSVDGVDSLFAGMLPAAVAAMIAVRMPREERMMLDQFGAEYEGYVRRTKRLAPGVW